jgi:cytochrome c biogenesis protein CcdA
MTEPARSSRRANRPRAAAAGRPGAAEAAEKAAAASSPHAPLRPVTEAVLFLAFGFTIMADPVSSVAYTIEASLRALHGNLGLLMATQLIVLGDHLAGRRELLAAGGAVPSGRRLSGGSRSGVRHGVGVRSDRR